VPQDVGADHNLHRAATAAGTRVAIGHTNAGEAELGAAVAAGAVLSTHLGNGSHQALPRHANYVQVQLADDRLSASFIADGHHLPWYALKNFLRSKGMERSILVTDAVAAADAPPGRYRLGEEELEVTEELRVSKPGQPNLAGSALTLDRAVVNVAVHCGVPFAEAWAMASSRPAALLGIEPPREIEVMVSAAGFSR
jgi:N-acetylglucosamine-6-phosphate deacetylase